MRSVVMKCDMQEVPLLTKQLLARIIHVFKMTLLVAVIAVVDVVIG